MRSSRAQAGTVALGLTVLLAVALIALEAFDAPWLAAAIGALVVAIFAARELTLASWKAVLAVWALIAATVALAFVLAHVT